MRFCKHKWHWLTKPPHNKNFSSAWCQTCGCFKQGRKVYKPKWMAGEITYSLDIKTDGSKKPWKTSWKVL